MKARSLLYMLTLATSAVSAGQVNQVPVLLDLQARTASGSMSTARYSDNPFEFIGCGVRYSVQPDGSLFGSGFCQAGIAEDVFFTCFTENLALVDRISSGSDYSYVTFRWNANDECTFVGFSTQSFYLPSRDEPKKNK